MARFTRIEEIECWKESIKLSISIYNLKTKSRSLRVDYGFVDQIQWASVSIPSNISEGFERQTHQEFIHFLFIAKGSCGELRTQLLIAKRINYIIDKDFEVLNDKCKKISSMIMNLIKSLRTFKR